MLRASAIRPPSSSADMLKLTGLRLLPLLLLAVLAGCAATPRGDANGPVTAASDTATQARAETGVLDGAPWRLDVPADWNGELVMYLHGYEPQGSPRAELMPAQGFSDWLVRQGYAVAQSEYRTQGWAVAEAIVDNERLRQLAHERLGRVTRTWAIGHSMGGHVLLATLERHGAQYAGGLSLCGANAPASELMHDGLLPPLVAFDHAFPGILGTAPGGLADPAAPPFVPAEVIEQALATRPDIADRLAATTEVRRTDLAGTLMLYYVVLRELAMRSGGFPLDNTAARYQGHGDDEAFNQGVRRYRADPAAAAYLRANADLRGEPGAPVVILSNVYDQTVQRRFSARYAELAATAGRADAVMTLPAQGEGHCNFDLDAVAAAFATLRARAGEM
jgi:pimeloyl-ACP methyl ester carboxylesterase